MKSTQVIRAKLVNRTNADCSTKTIENNKVHYYLKFDDSRGWGWLEKQVESLSEDENIPLDLYKIETSGMSAFEVVVRELCKREDTTDDSQRDFSEF